MNRVNDINPNKNDIMIIDDSPANLKLLSQILSDAGYEVRLAPSGELGLRSAFIKPPVLFLLDIKMPEMDGFEVCLKLKANERTASIPIIFISASDGVDEKIKAFEVGGFDYICKPFKPEEVLVRIKALLSLRKVQTELENANAELLTARDELQEEVKKRTWESNFNLISSDIMVMLLSPYSLEEISDVILDCALKSTNSEFGFAGFIDPKTGYLYCPAFTKGIWDECAVEEKIVYFKNFDSLWGWVLNNKKPLLTNSPQDDLRPTGIPEGHLPIKKFLAAPAIFNDRLLGIVAVANSSEDYEEKHLRFINMLSEKYALAIEKIQVEDKLSKFTYALEQSPVSIVITDNTGNIEYVNSKFTSVTGYAFGEVIHRNPRILKSGEKSPEEYKELWNTIGSGEVWRGELHNKRKNGELFWESASISPVKDQNGDITHYIAVKEDITEIKKTHESLLESETRFRSVWENSFSGMRLADEEGKIVQVNESFCRMVEMPKEKLEGMLYPIIYQSDDNAEIIDKYKKRFIERSIESNIEKEMTLWNGKKKWFELSNSYIDLGSKKPLLLSIFRDITQRKLTESALAESEKRLSTSEKKYRQLVETAREGILRIDSLAIIVYANKSIEEMLCYEKDELLGKSFFSLLDQKNTQVFLKKLENRKIGISEQYDIELLRKDGELVFMSFSASPTVDDNGNITGSSGIFTDITERKHMENILIAERHLFDSLMNNSPDLIYFKDLEGKYIRINKSLANWLGLKDPQEAVGKNDFDFFSADAAKKFSKDEKRIIQTGEPLINVDELTVFKDKNTNWTSATKMPYRNRSGEIIGIFGINRDISERKFLEQILWSEKEELKVTLKNVGDGVVTTNKDGLIVLLNQKAEKITGWNQSEAFNMPITEVFVIMENKKEQMYINPIKKILSNSNKTSLIDEATLITKDNKDLLINYNVSSIFDIENDYAGFVIVFRDITEQKKIETQVVLSQKMESIGQLASGIAHEINTPMQYIGDNTRFIQDSFKGIDEVLEWYDKIEKAKENHQECESMKSNLKNIIQNIDLDYLRGEIPTAIEQSLSGIERVRNIVLAMKDFAHPGNKSKAYSNLNHGIEVTATISRNEWKYVAELEMNLQKDLPNVFCNLDEINQVILNMIVNAAHAIKDVIINESTEKGKILIVTEADGDFAVIKISDTGKGIPKEHLNRIFDPFFTTKEVGKGTGQGLAIAHDIIVNKHKGEIQLDSEVGRGTTFILRIPMNEMPDEKQNKSQEGVPVK